MRALICLLCLLLAAGCGPRRLYMPEVAVLPSRVAYGGIFRLSMYGSKVAQYRFMGAVPGVDGAWFVRLDPLNLGSYAPAQVAVRPGDVLPLGYRPTVQVRFVAVSTTGLELEAVAIHSLPYHEWAGD